jgi:hypothetical protein
LAFQQECCATETGKRLQALLTFPLILYQDIQDIFNVVDYFRNDSLEATGLWDTMQQNIKDKVLQEINSTMIVNYVLKEDTTHGKITEVLGRYAYVLLQNPEYGLLIQDYARQFNV